MKSFRLSCSTSIYHEYDILTASDLISQDGFDWMDLYIIRKSCWGYGSNDVILHNALHLREFLRQHSLSISSLTVVPGYLNTSQAEIVMKFIEHCIDLAAILGAKMVSLPSGELVERDRWTLAASEVAERFRKLADYSDRKGVVISIEAPHWRTLTEDTEQSVEFFKLLSDDRIKCTFDTSHVFRGERVSLPVAFGKIGAERINHIHLRDVLKEDITVTPGRGHVDFRGFLSELYRLGYNGHLSFELEFESLSTKEKRAELRFAKRYIECILEGKMPLILGLRTSPPLRGVERFYLSPVKEIRRYPRLINSPPLRVIKSFRSHLLSLKPVRIYDGYWTTKRIPMRNRFIIQKPNSIRLKAKLDKGLRVCVQGCGGAGVFHSFGYQRLDGVQVVGVCDVDMSMADVLAQKLACNPYNSLAEMIEVEKPNIVSVCTREWQHRQSVIMLLENGIDVFCEKILATKFGHAQEMVDLAKRNGRMLGVNYNYRFMSGIQRLKEVIESGVLGDLQLLNISVHAFSYHHALDLIYFLGGNIQTIRATYVKDDSVRDFGGTDWDLYESDILYVPSRSIGIIFELQNGAIATLTSSYLFEPSEFILHMQAVLNNGAITLSGISTYDTLGRFTWTSKQPVPKEIFDHKRGVFARGYEYCFYKSIESFVNAYVGHKPPETSGEHGIFLMQLERAISKANSTGAKVSFHENW